MGVVVGVGPVVLLAVRFLVIVAGVLVSGWADSVDEVGSRESRLRPLLPCTLGSHPFSPFWMVEVCCPLRSRSVSLLRGVGGSRGDGSAGVDVDLVRGGVSLREELE